MRSRGSRSKERWPPIGAPPSTRGPWRRCRPSATTTMPGWRSTRRRRVTVRRRCAMRPRPPAGPASHREAAAQFERALRFTDGADPATVAGLYDGFAYEVSLLDRWQEAADARERALGLWRDVGDRRREGDTLRWLAYSLCSLSRGDEGIATAQAAMALLEPLGPSVELAWSYAGLAAMWMVRRANADAIELARRAQAVAGPMGLTEVLSDALNSEACAVHTSGGEWAGTLHQALDSALAGQHEAEVARAYVNLHSCYVAD